MESDKDLSALPHLQSALPLEELGEFMKSFNEKSLRETVPAHVVGTAIDSMIKGDNRAGDDTATSDNEDHVSVASQSATFVSSGKDTPLSKAQAKRARQQARKLEERARKKAEEQLNLALAAADRNPPPPETKETGKEADSKTKEPANDQETMSATTEADQDMPALTDIPIEDHIWDPLLMIRKIGPAKISAQEAIYLCISEKDFNSGIPCEGRSLAEWKIRIYKKIVDYRESLPKDLLLNLIGAWKDLSECSFHFEGVVDGACLCSEMADRMKALELFRSVERAEKRMTRLLAQGEASAKSTIDQTEKMAQLINQLSSLASSIQGDYDQMKLTISQLKPRPHSIPESSRAAEDAPLPVKKKKIIYTSKHTQVIWNKEKDRAVDIKIKVPKPEYREIAGTYEETFLSLTGTDQKNWMKMEPVDLIEVLHKMKHSGPFDPVKTQVAVNMLHSEGKIREGTFKEIPN
nr:P protein [Betaricinrhavirus chimay]